MGIGRNTIAKYREGAPKELSMYGIRQSKLDPYYDFIIQCLNSGWSKSKTVKAIYEKGYSGSTGNAFEHLCKIEKKENKCFEPQPYVRTMTECLRYKAGSTGKEKDYITREGVFRHMWMNTELTDDHKKYSNSSIKALKRFADGLKRDIDTVENAVAYNFSNGFVEGTNSRLKMIKRSMYGRCGKQLPEAKLRYTRSGKNG